MPEQMGFDFGGDREIPPPASHKNQEREEIEYNFETEDQCQYCNAPFESERSCQFCKGNPTKHAYLKNKNK